MPNSPFINIYKDNKTQAMKAVTIWGDEGWEILSGNEKERPDTEVYYAARVPMVFRGMQIRADSVASIPYELVDDKTDKVVDSSDDWKNKCGFLPSPEMLLWLIEAAWVVSGRAYLYRSANADGYVKILRCLAPESVTYSPEKNQFSRKVKDELGTIDKIYPPSMDKDGNFAKGEAIVYLWLPDPDVEKGPPLKFPGKAALQAMGVLYNLDDAATGFFKRGMLDTFIFSVPPGTQQRDKDELEDKVKNFLSGIKNAWRTLFINVEKITPVNIGGGLDKLANVPLTKEKREDISIALGIPMSILFSETARGLGGKGVVDADDRRLVDLTSLPDWKKIAKELNRQLLIPAGYRLVEHHEKMPIYQENEVDRSTALLNYTTAFNTNPEVAAIGSEIVGLKWNDETKAKVDKIIAEKKALPPPTPPVAQTNPTAGEPTAQANTQDMTAEKAAFAEAIEKWQRFELNHLGKKSKPAFVTAGIPQEMIDSIQAAIVGCKTADDIRHCFKGVIMPAQVDPALRLAIAQERLADEIKTARLALENSQ